jgi:hypothetical protein
VQTAPASEASVGPTRLSNTARAVLIMAGFPLAALSEARACGASVCKQLWMSRHMKVFISWSGNQSYSLAECLADWLPNVIYSVHVRTRKSAAESTLISAAFRRCEVFGFSRGRSIQRARPFISTGISKGARWSTIIASELNDTDFGILCVTGDNIDAPWLLFEAGAISKSLTHGKVAPILIGITKDALSGSPLSQFQLTELVRDEMFDLVKSLNEADADRLDDRRLQEAFDAFWPKFENAIKARGLSDTPTTATSLSQTSSNTTGAKAQEADAETETPEARIYKVDAERFELIVSEIEQSQDFGLETEFWTALFAHRRHELGITGETASVRTMHEKAPTSFWPLYFLAQEALAAGDLKAASEQMRSLPPPDGARSKAHLEILQRELAAQLSDPNDGLQHIKAVLTGAVSDVSKANTIESFAAKNATGGSGMASCILREFALRLNPSDQNVRFNLAHKLAEFRSSSAVAFEQYGRVRASSSALGPNATHNMGVIASSRGIPALMYKLYDEAESKGVALSTGATHEISCRFCAEFLGYPARSLSI